MKPKTEPPAKYNQRLNKDIRDKQTASQRLNLSLKYYKNYNKKDCLEKVFKSCVSLKNQMGAARVLARKKSLNIQRGLGL